MIDADLVVRCPAKINLDLRVGPLRADGFHSIRSWFVTVGLYDELTVGPADDVRLTCDEPSIPTDERNLVVRAANALRPANGPGVAMHLAKRIPAGGGLGGGSSNAATALVALNAFWHLGLSPSRLHAIAATLGSDVPFFLHGPSSLCVGRGEVITPVPPPPCRWAVLILPPIAMPTPAVFRKLDELRPHAAEPLSPSQTAPAGDALGLLATLVNDLEVPAFASRPDLADLSHAAADRLGRPVRMSGSGSTLFTLYDEETEAVAGARLALETVGVHAIGVPIAPSP